VNDYQPEPGDLIRFVKSPVAPPPYIIPHDKSPLGLVISVKKNRQQSLLGYSVKVLWSIQSWNISLGTSEEMSCDLIVIQKAKT
jgi:hypothetical protein